jgi:hypothetical protein
LEFSLGRALSTGFPIERSDLVDKPGVLPVTGARFNGKRADSAGKTHPLPDVSVCNMTWREIKGNIIKLLMG